jgi:hypothetical protein
MKNIQEWQLKKCIFMNTDEYDKIIKSLFGSHIEVEFTLDGMWVGNPNVDSLDDICEISFDELSAKLAEYFDVEQVTSVHMDDCDEIGVWICYKDKEVTKEELITKRENLWVCEHCLAAIESREGNQTTLVHYIDEEDDESVCDWCEFDGCDKLYELI